MEEVERQGKADSLTGQDGNQDQTINERKEWKTVEESNSLRGH